jgi:hypothetical protein
MNQPPNEPAREERIDVPRVRPQGAKYTAFVTATHCIPITYKLILFQCLARKERKIK